MKKNKRKVALYKALKSDYSSIEIEVTISCDCCDPHLKTASEIFGVPCNKVTSKMRRLSKVVNIARIYGG